MGRGEALVLTEGDLLFQQGLLTRHVSMAMMTDRGVVGSWVEAYEHAWRAPGIAAIPALFTADAVYLHSPYEEPVIGVDAIGRMWEEDREGPNEAFTLSTEVVAVDDQMAVVRAEVHYGQPVHQEYRDLWVLQIEADGRCSRFEEWPFWPGRSYSARES